MVGTRYALQPAPPGMTDPAARPAPPEYRALFHATPAPLLVLTPELRIAAVNEAYLEATATTREELIGRHVFEAFPDNPEAPEARAVENLHASLLRVIERRTADAMPLQRYDIRVRDGNAVSFATRYWSPINTPVFDADGGLTHILHRAIDVTALVDSTAHATRLETEVAAKAAELQNASHRLHEANRQLERERDLREQFVLTLSQDLRTPLSAATMGSHVIGRKADDPNEVRRIGARVLANLGRIDRMLRDLLDASRVDAGGELRLAPGRCDLHGVVRAVVDDLGTVHGDRFRVHALASPVGHWDCEGLRRVIEKLAINAIRYGRPEGPVTVTLRESPDHAVIEVHNEGEPIPPEAQAAIFAPHFRQHAHERDARKSWGLGLTVVRGIVDAHGGTIEVHSTRQDGTTFRVRLPLAPDEAGTGG